MENLEFEKMDELIRLKSFSDLTREEKEWVKDQMGGEEAYTRLRTLVLEVSSEKVPDVPGSLKKSLVMAMRMKHSRPRSVWYNILNYRIPAYAGFLALLLIMTLYAITLPPEEVIVEKTVEVPSEPVVDTVYIQSKPDTIFIEKIIEKPIYLTREVEKTEPGKSPATLSGKSLADQEDIRSLLSRLD